MVRYSKKDQNKLIKLIQDENIVYQQKKIDCEIAMTTILDKIRKTTTNYIRGYNVSKKYAKAVEKVAN